MSSSSRPGKTYLFKHTTQTLPGTIDTLRYRVDVNTLHRNPAPQLELNEIGRVSISLSGPIYFDAYRRNRGTGAFIVVENIIDDERRKNVFGLLMSLNMLIEIGDGFDYTGAQFRDWCGEVGFSKFDVVPLAGPTSAAIAYK